MTAKNSSLNDGTWSFRGMDECDVYIPQQIFFRQVPIYLSSRITERSLFEMNMESIYDIIEPEKEGFLVAALSAVLYILFLPLTSAPLKKGKGGKEKGK